jgi:hypothetical protein
MKPYNNISTLDNVIIRKFNNNINPIELKWHRDLNSRNITILEGKGWKYQQDNQLPINLEPGVELYIPKLTWHRIIKGNNDLIIQIKEMKNTNLRLRQIIREEIQDIFNEAGRGRPKKTEEDDVEVKDNWNKQDKDDISIDDEDIDKTATKSAKSGDKEFSSLNKAISALKQVEKEMKSLAGDYKKSEGKDKENIISKLKEKTKIKKELEQFINKLTIG